MKSESVSMSFYKAAGPSILDDRAHRRTDDLRFVEDFCTKSHKVLDLGCGVGRVTIRLALAGYDVHGIDLSSNLVGEARRRLKENGLDPLRVRKGSMLKLPYRKDSFDRIICLWTTFNELLEKGEQLLVLSEMKRVLRPGGIAFLDLVNGELKGVRQALAEHGTGWQRRVVATTIDGTPHFCFFHDRKSLESLCRASEFDSFEVKFMNLGRKRRIVAFLKKSPKSSE